MRVGLGWEGTQALTEDMDKGTFPNPTTISLPLGGWGVCVCPSPLEDMWTHTQIPDPFFLGML